MAKYKWVSHNGNTLFNVGILEDGSLHNPRGYPDDIVRAAVLVADARRHERRSQAAKAAGETRRRRRQQRTHEAARAIVARHGVQPSHNCFICGRGLADHVSIARGIGSECWQGVLSTVEALRGNAKQHMEVT
jgi:hypothetical protein